MFCILFTMCTYPSQSVKISIHSCTFSKNLLFFLFQERIKRSQQFGFIYHTACAPQYFSVSEKHQRRHGLDSVLACCYAVLIYIHLDDSDAVAQHTLHLLRMGCIALQGWHHVAKKSTRTSCPLFITLLNVSIIIYLFP